MREAVIKKKRLHDADDRDDMKDMTPAQLMGMVWRLTLDAWTFKENIDAEPRLQKHIVVLRKCGC